MRQENKNIISYNQSFLELNRSLIEAMRERSHEKLCGVLNNWNQIYKNAMKNGFHFWAGQALTDFQNRLEDAVTQHAYKGSYFAQSAITEHGVITPFIFSHFVNATGKNRDSTKAMVMNMINNGSYFMPKEQHKYIEDIGRTLYTLINNNDIDLAAMLYEKIVPGLSYWYEFRRIVVMTMSYADHQCDTSNLKAIINNNLDRIKSYTPNLKDLQNDDSFNTTEILFLFQNGLNEVAENALNFTNNARWISELIEIEGIRKKEFSPGQIEELMKRSADTVLGYLFLKQDDSLKSDLLRKFSSIDISRTLKQFAAEDIEFNHGEFKNLIERRFNHQSDYASLVEMATRIGVQNHPALMSSSIYKRYLLNHDLSM
jgi:hypothetical protein